MQNSLGWDSSICSQDPKPFPGSSTVSSQVPSLLSPFWIYQIQDVQNASSDFASEICLSLMDLPISADSAIVHPVADVWNREVIPDFSLVLTSHTHFINEFLLILPPKFISNLPSSSCLYCSFCGRTSCPEYGNSLLVGPTLSSPVSFCCKLIMLHPTDKSLNGSPLYFARKSSNSLPWSTH